ncbi:Hint domain-containing homing endonuclease [Prosthecomicrobium hirschii]|uniref:Hint domain-containing homing endonuclease n=1 Tax=Prosthecodimorpha hirschii TaxID=665126 RepID=UPI0009F8F0F2|nr:Hint domain-containing homing endonuclease [Prosthecomicrobium hirschii]
MLLRPRQKLFVERSVKALGEHGNTIGVAPTGCHAPGTPILMFDGSVRSVETIAVGDILMGPGTTPRRVLSLHRGRDEMVEIRPIKGDSFVVNLGHILTLVRTEDGPRPRCRDRGGELIDIPVSEWMAASDTFRHLHKLLRVPTDFPERAAPVLDPYFLGILIGDGSLRHSVSVTTPDIEIVDAIYRFAEAEGLRVRCVRLADNNANTYHLLDDRSDHNALVDQLRHLGLFGKLSGQKFIPDEYRLGSREVRLAMLAGLIDTDGHLMTRGCFEYCSKSHRLAEDFVFVARSVGLLATMREKEVNGEIYLRVHVSGDLDRIPTRVLRKQAPPRRQKKNVLRTGFTVHPVGVGDFFGFTVDGDHRYLLGDFTITHNSGKTLMLSAVAGEIVGGSDAKACVLAHRDELTAQNRAKFARINPAIPTSVVDAGQKSWDGQVTFAMVPTLARPANLDAMPGLDLLVIDEAHHAVADSYRRIIDRAVELNPMVRLFGVTATPNRGDRKGLRAVFSNVADQIRIGELIGAGHLIRPRTFVIDVGVQNDLQTVRRTAADFDMAEVDAIMNRSPVTDEVVRHWREKAGDRQTVVFCSTVDHAENVADAFRAAGVAAGVVHGDLDDIARRETLAAYGLGELQVVVNVAVLTEGWDHPPTSCVVLLRPSSYKSTMIQMVGRGLRTVDPREYPGLVKSDCIVLDFGTSTLLHGSLEQDVDLDGREPDGEAPIKKCPSCEAVVPLGVTECPLCGHVWTANDVDTIPGVPLGDFIMSEIDLLERSSFEWSDLFGDATALVANGFHAWAGTFVLNGRWYGVGGLQRRQPHLIAAGERAVCLAAADDWLNANETVESAHKSRSWLRQPPTERQLAFLPATYRSDYGLTRYRASALLTFTFNQSAIRSLIFGADAAGERSAA